MLATPDGGRTYEGGATIFRQGDAANGEAYLVHEGIVEVSRVEDAGERRVLRTLSQGELLGEVALFRAGPHSATAVALEPVTSIVSSEERLEDMVRTKPSLASESNGPRIAAWNQYPGR